MERLNTSTNPPRLVSPRFKQGDRVFTKWHGPITAHTIQRVATDRICQSGVMYKVSPSLTSDWGDWYDEAWFAVNWKDLL